MPKSAILPPVLASMRFSGLTSRCRIPASWARERAPPSSRARRAASAGGEAAVGEDARLERGALDVLEDEVEADLLVLPHVVQDDEVRVRDARRRPRLVLHPGEEPFPHVARDLEVPPEVLDGHVPVEHRIVREQDPPHRPLADEPHHLVPPHLRGERALGGRSGGDGIGHRGEVLVRVGARLKVRSPRAGPEGGGRVAPRWVMVTLSGAGRGETSGLPSATGGGGERRRWRRPRRQGAGASGRRSGWSRSRPSSRSRRAGRGSAGPCSGPPCTPTTRRCSAGCRATRARSRSSTPTSSRRTRSAARGAPPGRRSRGRATT